MVKLNKHSVTLVTSRYDNAAIINWCESTFDSEEKSWGYHVDNDDAQIHYDPKIKEIVVISSITFSFDNREDAVLFSLRWS